MTFDQAEKRGVVGMIPHDAPLPPTELKSDEELARQVIHEIDSRDHDRLGPVTALIAQHTGQLRQRIGEQDASMHAFEMQLMNALHNHSTAHGDIIACCENLSRKTDHVIPNLRDRLALVERERDEARKAHRLQQENYIRLYEAVRGGGTVTSDFVSPEEIVTKMHAELSALRQQAAKDSASEGQK